MEFPVKRKRGRPRKTEPTPTPTPPVRFVPSVDPKITSVVGDSDEMVGRAISGVVEEAFEEGYILNVKLVTEDDDGSRSCYLRGVVFRPNKVEPITLHNDIAPNAKMYQRKEVKMMTTSSNSQKEQTCHQYEGGTKQAEIFSSANGDFINKQLIQDPPICTPSFRNYTIQQVDEDVARLQSSSTGFKTAEVHPPSEEQRQVDTTHHLLFNSTTYSNLNLELNQPPTFMETDLNGKLMDMFPPTSTCNNEATSKPDG